MSFGEGIHRPSSAPSPMMARAHQQQHGTSVQLFRVHCSARANSFVRLCVNDRKNHIPTESRASIDNSLCNLAGAAKSSSKQFQNLALYPHECLYNEASAGAAHAARLCFREPHVSCRNHSFPEPSAECRRCIARLHELWARLQFRVWARVWASCGLAPCRLTSLSAGYLRDQ